ncbi:MAG: 3'-5' exonuclease [Cellvibrionaceae bacterium]
MTADNGEKSLIATLDIEASGIHAEAYPIEVGVSLPNGKTWCSLIRPSQSWKHWDKEAETIHGISQEELISNGKSPTEVAGKLNQMLSSSTVYSDCWVLDQPWLTTLFQQAGMPQSFTLLDMMHVMKEESYEKLIDTKHRIALSLDLARHRASNDAKILQLAYEELKE